MSPSYAGIIAEAIKQGKTEEEIAKAAEELGKNTEEAEAETSGGNTGEKIINIGPGKVSTVRTGGASSTSAASTNPDVAAIYEVLAPMAGDYLNAQAEQIGMAQRSMGPLAAAAMGQSQTAGLGNYTYNRLMRPQVDVMRDEIRVQGYANQLNRLLNDALNSARRRYNSNGGNPSNNPTQTGNGVTKIDGVDDETNDGNTTVKTTVIPNSYSYEDENGNMHTVTRPPLVTNETWARAYYQDRDKAIKNGRKFVDGK